VFGQMEQRIAGSKYLIGDYFSIFISFKYKINIEINYIHLKGPIQSYIPEWRSIYNYCWTS
jgi:hypothetical protein